MDPAREVSRTTLEEMCALACCAPNHHATAPWRFAIFVAEGRQLLGDVLGDALAVRGEPDARIAKTRSKYLRAPAMVLVGVAPGSSAIEDTENRDAVAAAVQTFLLAATGRGLATFWSSVAAPTDPSLNELCGFEPGTATVAAVYVGHPTQIPPPKDLSCPPVKWIGLGDGA